MAKPLHLCSARERCWSSAFEKAGSGWGGNMKPLSPFRCKRKAVFLLLGCCQRYFYQVNLLWTVDLCTQECNKKNISRDIWATKDTVGFLQQLSCQPWMPLAVCVYRLGPQRVGHTLGLKSQKDQANMTADTNKNVSRGGLYIAGYVPGNTCIVRESNSLADGIWA